MFHQSDADEGSTNTAHKGAFCPNFTWRPFLILMFVLELAIVCLLTFQPGVAKTTFWQQLNI